MMIVLYIIAGIIVYTIISILTTILFIYSDRKSGESAQRVYKDDEFYGYCVAGILFPISLPLLIIVIMAEKTKVLIIAIVETKLAIEKEAE